MVGWWWLHEFPITTCGDNRLTTTLVITVIMLMIGKGMSHLAVAANAGPQDGLSIAGRVGRCIGGRVLHRPPEHRHRGHRDIDVDDHSV